MYSFKILKVTAVIPLAGVGVNWYPVDGINNLEIISSEDKNKFESVLKQWVQEISPTELVEIDNKSIRLENDQLEYTCELTMPDGEDLTQLISELNQILDS